MKHKTQLSNREYDAMKVFWMESKVLLSKADFLWGEEEMKRSPMHVQRMLEGLRDKGMIEEAGEDTLLGKTYKAAVSYAEWIKNRLCEAIGETSEEEAMCCVLDAFAEKDGKVSSDMVKAMMEYLKAMEAKKSKKY